MDTLKEKILNFTRTIPNEEREFTRSINNQKRELTQSITCENAYKVRVSIHI